MKIADQLGSLTTCKFTIRGLSAAPRGLADSGRCGWLHRCDGVWFPPCFWAAEGSPWRLLGGPSSAGSCGSGP